MDIGFSIRTTRLDEKAAENGGNTHARAGPARRAGDSFHDSGKVGRLPSEWATG
jgi:hypothetical protein